MGENSKIEWTDHTFNPWIGCTKVSDGCKHCYAETLMDKRYGKVKWGPQGERIRTSKANWKLPLKWNRQAAADGVRRRVFCASLADVFEEHPSIISTWRRDLFHMIKATPNLDWLLLTKRPENFDRMVPWDGLPQNLWFGTSVEDQKAADERFLELVKIDARVRFLSVEPLLGPVIFDEWLLARLVQWVIVGGESGHDARPMHPNWVRSIRDQCQAVGVPFFFKQWGEWRPTMFPLGARGELIKPWGDQYMRRVGRKAAGRLLDGREWNEYPQG